ncbi:MAG: O-antigen ligase family protein [Ignavibacteria bacterium]|nr:O-antigen ligase family protein [Ignavibacteria bacterium]
MEKRNIKIILVYLIFSVFVSIPLIYSKITIDIFEFHRLLFAFLCLFSFLLLILIGYKFQNINKYFGLWISIVAILILIIIISNIINGKEELILRQIFYWLNLLNIAFITYFLFQELGENIFTKIPRIIIIPSIILSAIGILQLTGYNLIGEIASTRPGSLMNTRNFISDYLLVTLPFLLFLFLESNKKIEVIAALISIFILVFYLFSLRSRTAYLIILIHLIILLILSFIYRPFRYESKYLIKTIFLFLIVIISFFLSKIEFPHSDPERKSISKIITSFSDINYPPNISRIFYYDASLKMFIDNPIFGIGSGVWAGYFGKYHGDEFGDITTYNNSAIYAHNDFLEYLAETGILGFLAFSIIILFPLKRLFTNSKYEIKYLPFCLSLMSFVFISSIAFPKENINLMFIIIVCIIVSFQNNSEKKSLSNFYTLVIILLSIFILIFNFLRVKSENEYIQSLNKKAENKYSETIQFIEKINSYIYPIDPNKIPLNYYLGVGYYEIKNYKNALNVFDKALKIMPYFPQIISNKAITLYMIGEKEKSENLLLEIKRNFPYYYEPQINLLVLYMNDKRFNDAKELINEIETKEKGERYKNAKNYSTFLKIKNDLNASEGY